MMNEDDPLAELYIADELSEEDRIDLATNFAVSERCDRLKQQIAQLRKPSRPLYLRHISDSGDALKAGPSTSSTSTSGPAREQPLRKTKGKRKVKASSNVRNRQLKCNRKTSNIESNINESLKIPPLSKGPRKQSKCLPVHRLFSEKP